jgi:hypothetical protein
MNKHSEFLKFEAVLANFEKRVTEDSLFAAMKYGGEMQFFDKTNKLSQSGERLADII